MLADLRLFYNVLRKAKSPVSGYFRDFFCRFSSLSGAWSPIMLLAGQIEKTGHFLQPTAIATGQSVMIGSCLKVRPVADALNHTRYIGAVQVNSPATAWP
jgi:hypothetical protein